MRITSGQFKGKILASPEGLSTRPTSDRARQALFNILLHASWGGPDLLTDAMVIDVFAGTGALALEALSRGAAQATFFEQDRAALAALRQNISGCNVTAQARIVACNATQPPARTDPTPPATLAFFDPPYKKTADAPDLGAQALTALDRAGWLAADALCVMEMAKKHREETPAGWRCLDERFYGVACLRILKRNR